MVRSPGSSRNAEGRGDHHIPLFRKEVPALEPIVIPGVKRTDSDPGGLRPVASVDTDTPPSPYNVSTPELFETPVLTENPSPIVPLTAPQPHPDEGVQREGFRDNIYIPDARPPFSMPPATLPPDPNTGVSVEGWDNIIEPQFVPFLRKIKQRLKQATKGKIKRIHHPDQPFISLSIPRCAMRLLMSAASLDPSAFASHSGFLGPVECTPYYPTGDPSLHRGISFSMAMECIGYLEAYIHGDDDVGLATKLVALAQALSDLGLHDYALTASGFALDALQRPYATEPNNARLHIASALSLRANILCDLKKNDEANDAAERAMMLFKEHKNSQTAPVPELIPALLNYAVMLNAIDLKDASAAVAFELLIELDESGPEMNDVLALCKLCISTNRIGADDDMAQHMADETIDPTRISLDANSQTLLAGALLAKSKALSSKDQNDAASTISAEAVTLFRYMSLERPVFSLFLAHALDTHAHHLMGANHEGESYSVRQDAVEHWQTLRATAGSAVARPLAKSLFELAKFRQRDADRQTLHEEFGITESAVEMFRETEPLDAPSLGDALYLYANRMLELDKNREAATYAEESVIYFQEAASENPIYTLDLILALSLTSACLACTERGYDAFEYARQAVDVQHVRQGVGDTQDDGRLHKLLMNTVFRATEMDMPDNAAPWYEELLSLRHGAFDGTHQFSLFDQWFR